MTKKDVIGAILFLIVLSGVLLYLFSVFTFPKEQAQDQARERFNSFYVEEKNTLDGVYIGSSGVDRYWIPSEAWDKHGMAIYELSTADQPAVFIKYIMEESLKTQEPELFIVEVRRFTNPPEDVQDVDIRRVADNMNWSLNRVKATKAVLDYVENSDNTNIDTSDLSYFIPIIKYHSMWDEELTDEDWTSPNPGTEYKGYFAYSNAAYRTVAQEKPVVTQEQTPIPEANEKILNDLLDYCDGLDQKVLFVASPYDIDTARQEQTNYALAKIEERGYPVINFNTEEMYAALDFNFGTDMYNPGHANLVGAMKYTHYLADYLKENYSLQDHRGDEAYQSWDQSYLDLKERVKEKNEAFYLQYF